MIAEKAFAWFHNQRRKGTFLQEQYAVKPDNIRHVFSSGKYLDVQIFHHVSHVSNYWEM